MTSAQVVETSVNVISNSPSQDYTHPDDRTLLYDMTPGFKPFTIILYFGGQLIGGLQVLFLAGDHQSKGFRTFKGEYTSYTAPLAPI